MRPLRAERLLVRLGLLCACIAVAALTSPFWSVFDDRVAGPASRHLLGSESDTGSLISDQCVPGVTQSELFPYAYTGNAGVFIAEALGVLYMFIALAFVCDEYFIETLEVVSEKLKLTPDVAGATLLAMGSSAPELFTSLLANLSEGSAVGVGTIIGSGVFNMTVIMALSILFSTNGVLVDWRPIIRDAICYAISILTLFFCFYTGGEISWFEGLSLSLMYCSYVAMMSQNHHIMAFLDWISGTDGSDKSKEIEDSNKQDEDLEKQKETKEKQPGYNLSQRFKNPLQTTFARQLGLVTAMGLVEENVVKEGFFTMSRTNVNKDSSEDKPVVQTERVAAFTSSLTSLPSPPDANKNETKNDNAKTEDAEASVPKATTDLEVPKITHERSEDISTESNVALVPAAAVEDRAEDNVVASSSNEVISDEAKQGTSDVKKKKSLLKIPVAKFHQRQDSFSPTKKRKTLREMASEIRLKVKVVSQFRAPKVAESGAPKNIFKKLFFYFTWPLAKILWLTIPDTSKPGYQKFLPLTFILCLVWIAIFAHFMVGWATYIGCFLHIPTAIVGLTLLALGTSVPDALASVIVAKQGMANMAISSSLGSSVFDICLGLGLPWFIFSLARGESIKIVADGMIVYVCIGLTAVSFFVGLLAVRRFHIYKLTGYLLLGFYTFYIIFGTLVAYPVGNPVFNMSKIPVLQVPSI